MRATGRRLARRILAGLLLPAVLALPVGAEGAPGPGAAAAGWSVPSLPPPPLDVPAREPSGPDVTADAAVLIDAATGRVLWARNADEPRHPASTTKMMTALVALELGRPDQQVKVGRDAAGTPGSSAGISAGERYTLAQLLRGLLLRSGNDAAVAIAEAVSGSVPAFVARMNAKARALGLQDTHFVNPHGLTDPLHRSSAFDLALIARAGLRVPAFAALVDSAEAQMAGETSLGQEIRRDIHNTNRLLLAYDWVDGVKTGTTSAAGSCLVASGTRGGMQLIAVVLHSDDRWGDALRMLQWGFSHFSPRLAAARGQGVAPVPVLGARDRRARVEAVAARALEAPVGLDEWPWLTERRRLAAHVEAPVRAGQRLGTLTLLLAGRPLGSVPLLAAADVPRASVGRLLLRGLGLPV